MKKTPARAKWLLLATALLTVPVLVGVAEVAVRVFTPRIDPLSVFITSPQLRSDTQGETTRGLFEFDPLLCWRLRANLRGIWWDYTPVTTNSRHLRMDREVGAKKATRIVTLGDSVTFGYRVPTAHDASKPREFDATGKPYPVLLEESLRTKFPNRSFDVLPLACPGYTSRQGLSWLRRDIGELKPEFVLACFGWNDVRAAGPPDRATMPSNGAQVFARRLIGGSQLLLSIAGSAQRRVPVPLTPLQPEPRSSGQEYASHFLEMDRLCRQHGAWFGILLPVYRDPNTPGIDPGNPDEAGAPDEGLRMSLYRDRLREAARMKNIPALEIPELTERRWPANRSLFGERIHPNAAGHALIAERLADFLASHFSRGQSD